MCGAQLLPRPCFSALWWPRWRAQQEGHRRRAPLGAQSQVDVATFIAWADADQRGQAKLADFYVDRFRPEFKAAFDAWIALDPLDTAGAPPTPFAMDEYSLAANEEAARLDAESEASAATCARTSSAPATTCSL